GVGRAGPSPRAVRVEHPQHLADLDVLALLPLDAGEHAGALGADLEVDLVGLELDQRLAGGDGLSFLFQPARDARLDDGFTKLRDDDIHWGEIVPEGKEGRPSGRLYETEPEPGCPVGESPAGRPAVLGRDRSSGLAPTPSLTSPCASGGARRGRRPPR